MNNRIVWFTGAPGSKWSVSSTILQSINFLNFNTSDRSIDRQFVHFPEKNSKFSVVHTGSYFGPGQGIGEDFFNLSKDNPVSIENEIMSQWKHPDSGKLLVKSHFFTHNLDFIADTWKESPIVMIIRPSSSCLRGWYKAGGWGITYPNYKKFYKDDETIKEYIIEHNNKILEFCETRKIEVNRLNEKYLYEKFKWKVNDILDLQNKKIILEYLHHIQKLNDISIAIYNEEKLI